MPIKNPGHRKTGIFYSSKKRLVLLTFLRDFTYCSIVCNFAKKGRFFDEKNLFGVNESR